MNLDDIPAGSLCVIDTKRLVVLGTEGVSDQARRLLRRCSKGELIGTLPQAVQQELTHKLMLAEAVMQHGASGGHPAVRLADKPNVIRALTLYQAKVRALVDLGLRFEHCEQGDLLQSAFGLQRHYGLSTSDSVILAVAVRLKADCLVSSDKRLQSVEEIDVLAPSDLRIREAS